MLGRGMPRPIFLMSLIPDFTDTERHIVETTVRGVSASPLKCWSPTPISACIAAIAN